MILRLIIGTVFAWRGAGTLFGILHGPGLMETAGQIDGLGLTPAFPLAVLIGVVEFAGGLLLIVGAYAAVAALVLWIKAAVFAWWFSAPVIGRAPGMPQDLEYAAVLLAALACLMVTGAGALSFDRRRARRAETEAAGRARLRSGSV
jgi:putative oxidoreductase